MSAWAMDEWSPAWVCHRRVRHQSQCSLCAEVARRLHGLFSLRWETDGGGGREVVECCDQGGKEGGKKRGGEGKAVVGWGCRSGGMEFSIH